MREDIRIRLEQVQAKKAPKGYNRTSIGIVPVEWDVIKISSFLVEKKDLTNDIKTYPLYSSSRKGLVKQSEYYNNKEAVETNLGYKIVPDGYITYRHMSDDDVFYFNINNTGRTILVSSEYPVFTTKELNITYLIEHVNNMPRFLYFCRAQKMGGTRTRLYFHVLQQYKMPIPQYSEQQRIAELLNHCDTVIELKQQLIIEERNRKKWLLQNLLDPYSGVRLSGFKNQWETTKIKKIARVISGGTPDTSKDEYWNGSVLWCTPTDISSAKKYIENTEQTITELGIKDSSATILPIGTILMCSRATIGTKAIATKSISTNQGFKSFVCNSCLNNEFFYYYLDFIMPELQRLASGNTFRELSKDSVDNFPVKIPELDEQIAIGAVLSNADKIIHHMKDELSQWQQKKKALMQLLLTGLVRVSA